MAKLRNGFINKIICIMFATVICISAVIPGFVMVSPQAAGEDATITVTLNRNTLNVGDTFNVKVAYSSVIDTGYLTWKLSYDNSLVGRDGSSGEIIETIWLDNREDNRRNITMSYTFKAKAVGKAGFSISATGYALDKDENDGEDNMTILAIGASATIKDVGSSDATLKDLTVDGGKLVPSFSPSVTSYTVTVPYSVSTLYVFPETNDSRATHTIEGDEFLEVGTKKRTVVVTAQDGTVKKYVITITRQAKATEKPTETPSATNKPGQTSTAALATPTPTLTHTPEFDGTVMVDGVKHNIKSVPKDVKLPEGFEPAKVEIKDKEYNGGKGISKDITLLYLESESYKGLFIYFEKDEDFLKYVDINVKSGIYSLMKLSDAANKLDLNTTKITIGEETVDAYEIAPDNKDFYIIRAMNWNGEVNYYTYDAVEKTMQRYVADKLPSGENSDKNAPATSTPDATQNGDTAPSISKGSQKILIALVGAACGVCLIVAAFLVYFALKERKTCKIMNSMSEEDEE
ncbi:MAG: cadherin-like beta sandwich domain-containing protein [Ruminococcaceae bacterium]|nr:cadherin-like beta sandwich domain-containing protein [Oscillospiraceae bacterium]